MIFDTGKPIRLAVIGLGKRGVTQLSVLLAMPDVVIASLCDSYEDRVSHAAQMVTSSGQSAPFTSCDPLLALDRQDVDAAVIMTAWESHIELAVAALGLGKAVALEVGGASSVDECWQLVRAQQKANLPCMLLENCCYGQDEMQVLNMAKRGLFGEILHCRGGYHHDLRDEVGNGDIDRHYRQRHFLRRNGELYPTHELGPIAKLLDINRGNRMVKLSAMSTQSRGMKLWLEENRPQSPLAGQNFALGDIVTTMIQCARGETIVLTHDCTSPRPYSRGGVVQGTRGIWMEDNRSVFISGMSPEDKTSWAPEIWEPFDNYKASYAHPLWQAYAAFGPRGGHDGMDYLVLRAFITAWQNNLPTPIDVYDTAAWMAITCLSEQSIALGGAVVDIPDFTDGRWLERAVLPANAFALDAVHDSLFSS